MMRFTTILAAIAASTGWLAVASAQVFTNSAAIIINDNTAAAPYPSVITVSGAPTSIVDLKVTLSAMNHTWVGDVVVLLVAPDGTAIKLLEAAPSNSNNLTNMSVSFSTDATVAFPTIPASGTFRPMGGSYVLPTPAPATSGAASFDQLIGQNANGDWKLYVVDRALSDSGSITGGWSIQFFERNYAPNGFTYQGRLEGAQPGDPVALRFTVYDGRTSTSPLDLIAGPATTVATVAPDGTVTAPIDFGVDLPTDRQTFAQIDVSVGGAPFVPLSPRQPISPAPLALKSIESAHAASADSATVANIANSANSASFASNAVTATNATTAANATQLGGVAAASYARQDIANTFAADQIITTPSAIAFGVINSGLGSAENTDQISLRRANPATNQSELRLTLGDDPGTPTDAFSIGYTNTGANFIEVFRFQSNGVAIKPGGGLWAAPSDRRLKRNIQPLTGSLDKLMGLRGVSFEYNDPKRAGTCEGTMMGFVAQDVEPIFPRWVSTGDDGYKLLTITGFEALAVEALRELRAEKDAQIAELNAQIARMHEAHALEIEALTKRLERLESHAE